MTRAAHSEYQSGFGTEFATEALPVGRSDQVVRADFQRGSH
jgi:hypothetical protein